MNPLEKLTECFYEKRPELGHVKENFIPFQKDCRHKRIQLEKNVDMLETPIPVPDSYTNHALNGINIERYESSNFDYFKQRPPVGHVTENFVPFLSSPFTKTNQYQDTMLNSHTWGLNKTEHINNIPRNY